MRRLSWIVLICLLVLVQPLAANGPHHDQDIDEIKQVFKLISLAYANEDAGLYLRCHDPFVASTDVPRNTIAIYDEETTRSELEAVFAWLDNITMEFLEMEIITDRGVAVVKTTRRGTATGFPAIIYVKMVFTLRTEGQGWGGHWKIRDIVIVDEWYDFDNYTDPGAKGASTFTAFSKPAKTPNRRFF